ncbi:hypothetical protein BDR05DRAFT_953776 [Suillus weaverae]|nr:hypothetical protein BDR05DRAFT_953776 [Suillus weaverae]
MGPPVSIGNNIPPGPSVIIEDIHNMGPWSGGPYNTEFVTEGAHIFHWQRLWKPLSYIVAPRQPQTSPIYIMAGNLDGGGDLLTQAGSDLERIQTTTKVLRQASIDQSTLPSAFS